MYKLLSGLLCLILAGGLLLTACADNGQVGETSGNGNEGTPGSDEASASEVDPELLKLNFTIDEEPTDITFAFAEDTNEYFTRRSIGADLEKSDDSVDVAVEKRNAVIFDTLGVSFSSFHASESIRGLQENINAMMGAQDPEIDVIVGYQYYDINIATQGWICNLANMVDENNRPIHYINYDTKDYWGKAYIDALTYKDIVYWVTGDLALRYIGGIYCTYVNRRLYEEYLENSYGSIYDIVNRGEWTMEQLYTMASLIYKDDGNNIVDAADTVGYAWEPNDPIDGLAFGCQVPFSTKSADNSRITLTLNSQRTVDFVAELEKLLYGTHSVNVGDMASTIVMPIFNSGTVGFTVNKVFHAEQYLTKMADDYMIVPVPKLNKEQDHYVTGIHDGCSIFGISVFSDAKAASAAALEYMAYLSHKDVRPIYYDQALKNKYTNDSESAQMIDLIHSNIETDFAAAWSASIEDIVHFFRTNNKSIGLTRALKRNETAQNTALEDLLKSLEDYATES